MLWSLIINNCSRPASVASEMNRSRIAPACFNILTNLYRCFIKEKSGKYCSVLFRITSFYVTSSSCWWKQKQACIYMFLFWCTCKVAGQNGGTSVPCAVNLPFPVCLSVHEHVWCKCWSGFSLQFSVLVSILALAEVVLGVLAYANRDRVRGNDNNITDYKMKNKINNVNYWPRCCVLIFTMKVGLSIAEFYSSMYALYLSNGDPVIGVTLTFIHNTVRANFLLLVWWKAQLSSDLLFYLEEFWTQCLCNLWNKKSGINCVKWLKTLNPTNEIQGASMDPGWHLEEKNACSVWINEQVICSFG